MKILLAIIVMLNGKTIEFKDAKPFLEAGRVMIPLRGVFEKMGARVRYEPKAKDIWVETGISGICFQANGIVSSHKDSEPLNQSVTDIMNSTRRSADIFRSPVKRNHRFYLPLRYVSETLGAKVHWNNPTRTANITMSEKPSTPPAGIRAGEIEVRVASDKSTYRAGESVKFTVTVINQDDQPRTLHFPNGQNFDITVTPTNQNEALWRWDWSHDRMFTQMLREQVLKPGETLTFNATWNQKDNEGKKMPRGEYSVQAKLTTEKPVLSAATVLTLAE
jgi:hypothetical protein